MEAIRIGQEVGDTDKILESQSGNYERTQWSKRDEGGLEIVGVGGSGAGFPAPRERRRCCPLHSQSIML